jgi:hypothetical protein
MLSYIGGNVVIHLSILISRFHVSFHCDTGKLKGISCKRLQQENEFAHKRYIHLFLGGCNGAIAITYFMF